MEECASRTFLKRFARLLLLAPFLYNNSNLTAQVSDHRSLAQRTEVTDKPSRGKTYLTK